MNSVAARCTLLRCALLRHLHPMQIPVGLTPSITLIPPGPLLLLGLRHLALYLTTHHAAVSTAPQTTLLPVHNPVCRLMRHTILGHIRVASFQTRASVTQVSVPRGTSLQSLRPCQGEGAAMGHRQSLTLIGGGQPSLALGLGPAGTAHLRLVLHLGTTSLCSSLQGMPTPVLKTGRQLLPRPSHSRHGLCQQHHRTPLQPWLQLQRLQQRQLCSARLQHRRQPPFLWSAHRLQLYWPMMDPDLRRCRGLHRWWDLLQCREARPSPCRWAHP